MRLRRSSSGLLRALRDRTHRRWLRGDPPATPVHGPVREWNASGVTVHRIYPHARVCLCPDARRAHTIALPCPHHHQ
jgi:hypothetical protein